eukprot:gene25098-10740_t
MAATGLDLGDTEDPAEKDPLSCATRAASLALDMVESCRQIVLPAGPRPIDEPIKVSAIVVNRLRQAGKVGESMELKERGEVELKGRGKARTWWLSRPEQETETTSFTCGMEQVPYPSVDVTPTDLPRRTRSHGLGAPGPITPGNILPRLKVPSEARLHSRTVSSKYPASMTAPCRVSSKYPASMTAECTLRLKGTLILADKRGSWNESE